MIRSAAERAKAKPILFGPFPAMMFGGMEDSPNRFRGFVVGGKNENPPSRGRQQTAENEPVAIRPPLGGNEKRMPTGQRLRHNCGG